MHDVAIPARISSLRCTACRALNADVLEWLWYLNSHANYVHSRTGGDKDTFKLAFYLADRAPDFRQACTLCFLT